VAIVTGGGGGIGGAIVRRFGREGAKLAIVDIDRDAAKARGDEVESDGGTAMFIVADITNKQSVEQMTRATLERWGRIDILVNVAGGAAIKPVIDVTEAEWDHIIGINLKSTFLCSQAVLPSMMEQRYGKIVSISSIYGFTGNATRASYAAAKAGVAVFTKSLALEVVSHGITVNAIAPGRILTDRVRGHYSEAEWNERVEQIPMKRAGTPDEIAGAAVFLITDENKYITGQTIHVNGAWLNW
jgi:NAD(P)-dependent dehydrogenase (short-subunit alcohol dehydrogenase family)